MVNLDNLLKMIDGPAISHECGDRRLMGVDKMAISKTTTLHSNIKNPTGPQLRDRNK